MDGERGSSPWEQRRVSQAQQPEELAARCILKGKHCRVPWKPGQLGLSLVLY